MVVCPSQGPYEPMAIEEIPQWLIFCLGSSAALDAQAVKFGFHPGLVHLWQSRQGQPAKIHNY